MKDPTPSVAPIDVMAKLIPLRTAARLAKMRYPRLKAIVESGQLRAYRTGGTDARPHLRVDPDEVGPALLAASLHVPRFHPRLRKPAPRPQSLIKLHPSVTC
jgi:hypothetical protein